MEASWLCHNLATFLKINEADVEMKGMKLVRAPRTQWQLKYVNLYLAIMRFSGTF